MGGESYHLCRVSSSAWPLSSPSCFHTKLLTLVIFPKLHLMATPDVLSEWAWWGSIKKKSLQQRMGKKCGLGWRQGLCPSNGWMWHGVYMSVLSQSELLDWSFWSAWLRSFTSEMKELSTAALWYSSSGVRVEASLPILSPRAKHLKFNPLSCLMYSLPGRRVFWNHQPFPPLFLLPIT